MVILINKNVISFLSTCIFVTTFEVKFYSLFLSYICLLFMCPWVNYLTLCTSVSYLFTLYGHCEDQMG